VFIRKFGFAGADVDPDTVEYLTHLIASTPIEVVADFYSALLDHDKLEALPVLADIEVLVVCGDRDLVTPLEHSEQIVDALPTAELLVIHDAGHVAHMEQPEVVTDALAKLIASALEATASKRWWQFR
jgi:pimeloyl-ACP methyl ester carboxylesterase